MVGLSATAPCAHHLFEQQVRRTPAAIAVSCGGEQLTYRELDQRADNLARRLGRLGVKGKRVALGVERSLELVVSILGILKAGAAYVPLDPSHPEQRLAYILADAEVPVVVTQRHLAGRLPASGLRQLFLDADEPDEGVPANGLLPSVALDDLAYVIYTSGSTGRPKGAMITHRNLRHFFESTYPVFRCDTRDVWTLFHSCGFDFSVWEMWGALLHGGRLVVVPHDIARSSVEFYELVRRERVTVLNQTPGAFRQFIQVDESQQAELALRVVIIAGEALSLPILKPWFARHGDRQPRLYNVYGTTETTVFATFRPLNTTDTDPPSGSVIGQPFSAWEVYLLDEERRPVAGDQAGEVYVGGPCVGHGYLKRPELTAGRFLAGADLNLPTDRVYRTGDLARRLPNGDLVYLGRSDDQIKIRGFRIEPSEIQSALAEHPGVREVVVVAREDVPGEKRLVAYVVATPDDPPTPGSLRALARSRLPDYMVPAAYVPLGDLPLTMNGKVDRNRLPRPGVERTGVAAHSPQTPRQRQLVALWELLLHTGPIGIDDDFFTLGGDSLLAAALCLEIQKAFGTALSPAILIQRPSIRLLDEALNCGPGRTPVQILVPLQPLGRGLPFFCVHPIGGSVFGFRLLAKYLGRDRPFYGVQAPEALGHREPLTQIEAMAAEYVAAVREVQPRGPYHLGGYSLGAFIAHAMAQRLLAEGEQVAFLGLVDDGPALAYPQGGWGLTTLARLAVNLPRWLCYDLLDRRPADLFRDVLRRMRVWRRRMFVRQQNAAVDMEAVLDVSAFATHERRAITGHYQALMSYRPRPYPASMTLLRARSQPLLTPCPYDLGWSRLAAKPGALTVHEVPGNHLTILQEPYVRVVASRLATALAGGRCSQSCATNSRREPARGG